MSAETLHAKLVEMLKEEGGGMTDTPPDLDVNLPLSVLGMSDRDENALCRAGAWTIGEAIALVNANKDIRSFGTKSRASFWRAIAKGPRPATERVGPPSRWKSRYTYQWHVRYNILGKRRTAERIRDADEMLEALRAVLGDEDVARLERQCLLVERRAITYTLARIDGPTLTPEAREAIRADAEQLECEPEEVVPRFRKRIAEIDEQLAALSGGT
jgi:nucleotidyltransferase/DNA polymerase involved in DNA repair